MNPNSLVNMLMRETLDIIHEANEIERQEQEYWEQEEHRQMTLAHCEPFDDYEAVNNADKEPY